MGEDVNKNHRDDKQQTESTEKDHVDIHLLLSVKISILGDGQVPSSCTADDCTGGDGDGEEEIAV
jgi:hypothetical protein